jgi:hypothetical protein
MHSKVILVLPAGHISRCHVPITRLVLVVSCAVKKCQMLVAETRSTWHLI